MPREYRERFPRHHRLAIRTCITARAWRTCRDACRDRLLPVSFYVGGGENVPSIPGACTTRNSTYLVRGPWRHCEGPPVPCRLSMDLKLIPSLLAQSLSLCKWLIVSSHNDWKSKRARAPKMRCSLAVNSVSSPHSKQLITKLETPVNWRTCLWPHVQSYNQKSRTVLQFTLCCYSACNSLIDLQDNYVSMLST